MWQGLLEIWFLLLGDVHVTDPRRLFLRKAVGVDTTGIGGECYRSEDR